MLNFILSGVSGYTRKMGWRGHKLLHFQVFGVRGQRSLAGYLNIFIVILITRIDTISYSRKVSSAFFSTIYLFLEFVLHCFLSYVLHKGASESA
jgi:hypothetical protein